MIAVTTLFLNSTVSIFKILQMEDVSIPLISDGVNTRSYMIIFSRYRTFFMIINNAAVRINNFSINGIIFSLDFIRRSEDLQMQKLPENDKKYCKENSKYDGAA